jgi:hypothetical protein
LLISGKATTPAIEPSGSISAGSSVGYACGPPSDIVSQASGSQALGSFSLSTGASVPFSGTWR